MTTETDATYNGWANRQTWLVNLWLTGDDQGTYDEIRWIVKSTESKYDAADRCRGFVETMCLGEDPKPGLSTDLLLNALAQVDWDHIVESLLEE